MKQEDNSVNRHVYVDVIIPVFNASKYLRRCILSLERQDYKYIKIIIVDDGSTDDSGYICDGFKSQFNNVSVIHQANYGVSAARNTGLRLSKSEYIIFIDPDDWIGSDYIFNCMRAARKNNYPDLIFTPYSREYKGKSIKNDLYNTNKNILFNQHDFRKKVYINLFGRDRKQLVNPLIIDDLSPIWSKFYKRNIIVDEFFTDIKKVGSEDLWFNVKVLFNVNKALYIYNEYYKFNYLTQLLASKSYMHFA